MGIRSPISCKRVKENFVIPIHPYTMDCSLVASVAMTVIIAVFGRLEWKESISCRGKSPHTSPFRTKKASGFPALIWSLKWYIPPAVPNAVYSCKYLNK